MAALMTACAPLTTPPQTEYPTGRARLVLPPGAWQDLGATDEIRGRAALQTRAVGLRSAQGAWLAIMRVQTNRVGPLPGAALWLGHCSRQQDVTVEDAAAGSPVRTDCLRFKRWGSSDEWLRKNRPDLAQWLDGRQIKPQAPFAHVSYHYATEGGAWVAVDALVDHRLLRGPTHNNHEFLTAGRPALQWARELAQAAQRSVGMMDGYLAVPPFPFSPPATATY